MNQSKNRTGPGWIDISVSLRDGMVHWPGDPPVNIRRVSDVARGDSHTLSQISMGSHTGTHIDAPLHFIKGGRPVSRMPFAAAIGRVRIIEIKDNESIKLTEIEPHGIRRGERIIFKTRNSVLWQNGRFFEDFVFMSNDAADYLAGRRVKLVGVDYLSVGSYKAGGGYPHRVLLGADIWLIEGLDLSRVTPGKYDLVCLPLKLENGDGAPARAVIRPV